ncbi:MAG: diaminopimelate decarboxylase [Gemmatimonadales bacterium]
MGAGVLGFDPGLLRAIAERVGTPAYVYSVNLIRAQYHALDDALRVAAGRAIRYRICYSVKANGNLGVLRVLKQLGAGADIVSVGELRRVRAAGFDPDGVVFSGVGKTAAEIAEAIRANLGFINIESTSELDTLVAVARDLRERVRVGIRVNPDVATETHPYTRTGEKTAKFGVPVDDVVAVARRIAAEPALTLRGLAMHVGSQLPDIGPYQRGTAKLLELVTAIRATGITTLEALDVGGGLGVRYRSEKAPTPKAFAEAVVPAVKAAGLGLLCEPGRYLVANAGVLLTRVLYRKHAGGKEYVIVDAGMTDFLRPSRYNAHHEIMPLFDGQRPEELVSVVGPVCETGDFLALDRKMPAVAPGEVLAVLGTGAYGFVMSSTYNQRPRPPEVVVEGDRYYVARQRESLDDLVRGETAEPTTWYRAGT